MSCVNYCAGSTRRQSCREDSLRCRRIFVLGLRAIRPSWKKVSNGLVGRSMKLSAAKILDDQPVAHLLSGFDCDGFGCHTDRRASGPVIFLQHWTTDGFVVHLPLKLLLTSLRFEDEYLHVEVR